MRTTIAALVLSSPLACSSGGDATAGQSDADTNVTSLTVPTAPATTPTTGEPTGGAATDDTDGATAGETTGPGASDATTGTDATTAPQTTTGTDDTGPGDTGDTGETSTGEPEACPCPDLEVALDDGIFVLSKTAQLWKYFPTTQALEMLGPIDCGVEPSTFSMGVDRQGFAWVQFSDLQLRKIDVTDVAQCSDPGFAPMQQGIENFGMAFVSNSAEDKCDRIYGNHYNGVAEGAQVAEFFSVDPVTLDVVVHGMSDYGLAELTGTGDGRAFLFAGPDPSRLVEVDKASGATIAITPLPGVKTGGGFAFAFFAGDFYFFTDAESDGSSEVTRIDYDDSDNNGQQDLDVVLEDAPIRIVGAGVSTCAPLVPQ
jgi:hypothetical protein